MRARAMHRWSGALGFLLGLAADGWAQGPPLDRDLGPYCLFAMRSMDLKNLTVNTGCNVGVNCAQPTTNSDCGTASFQDVFLADGSQLASDVVRFARSGASVWQLFRNRGSSLADVLIRLPGSNPDGSNPLTPLPILADADGDGTPSCRTVGGACVPDVGDLEAACGFPVPFPACVAGAPVDVRRNEDCRGPPDAVPGNGRCDLAPGAYGDLEVENGAVLSFVGGAYAFCKVNVGRNTTVIAADPATLAISGDFGINNAARVGLQCGDLTLFVRGPGDFSLGRGATIVADVCAPQRALLLGTGSDFTGRLVGDTIPVDFNVRFSGCPDVEGSVICGCFDDFSPRTAAVGDTITFTGSCDLRTITDITICGIPASITVHTASDLRATVPAGASGACEVRGLSSAGKFTAAAPLQVL